VQKEVFAQNVQSDISAKISSFPNAITIKSRFRPDRNSFASNQRHVALSCLRDVQRIIQSLIPNLPPSNDRLPVCSRSRKIMQPRSRRFGAACHPRGEQNSRNNELASSRAHKKIAATQAQTNQSVFVNSPSTATASQTHEIAGEMMTTDSQLFHPH